MTHHLDIVSEEKILPRILLLLIYFYVLNIFLADFADKADFFLLSFNLKLQRSDIFIAHFVCIIYSSSGATYDF